MPLAVPRYTLEDLESFPDDGNKYELLDGVLLVTPGPGMPHELVVAGIVRRLHGYVPENLARVFARGSVEVEPNTHLEPDVLVLPQSEIRAAAKLEYRWAAITNWWLAVEVSGPGSEFYDRHHKGRAYRALGVRDYWRVNVKEQAIYASRPDREETCHRDRIVWHPPELDRPLEISVPDLFR